MAKELIAVDKTVDVRQDKAADALAAGLCPKISKLVKSGSTVKVYLEVDGVLGAPLVAGTLVAEAGKNIYAEARLRVVQSDMDEASVAAVKVEL